MRYTFRSRRRWNFDILEDRLALTQAPWSVLLNQQGSEWAKDVIVDDGRHLLYITTGQSRIERYDWVSQQLLAPLFVNGGDLGGGDITPDGKYLLVADQSPVGNLSVVHKINLIDESVTDIAFAGDPVNGGTFDVALFSNQTGWLTLAGNSGVTLHTIDLYTDTVSEYLDAQNQPVYLASNANLERSANRASVSIRSGDSFSSSVTMWLAAPASKFLNSYDVAGSSYENKGQRPSWSPDGQLFSMQTNDEFVSIDHADGSPDQLIKARAGLYTPDGKYFLRFDETSFIAQNRLTGNDDWSVPAPDAPFQLDTYGSIGRFSSDSSYLFTLSNAGVTITPLPDANEHDVATQFVVTPSQSVFMVGTPVQFQVTAKDYYGRTVTDYTGTIAIGVYGYADIDQTPYTFLLSDQGAHTFTATFQDVIQQYSSFNVYQVDNFDIQGSAIVSPINAQLLTYNIYPYVSKLLDDSAHSQFFALSDNNVLRFDMKTHQLLGQWQVGARPYDMALSQDGHTLFITESIAHLNAQSVYRLDLQTGVVTRIDTFKDSLESGFYDIVGTSDGKFLLATLGGFQDYGSLFQLRTLDPQTNSINYYGGSFGSTLLESGTTMTATPDGKHVLFANNSGGLRWLDTTTGFDAFTMNLSSLGVYPRPESVSRGGQLFAIRTNNLNNNQMIVVNRQGTVVQSFDSPHVQFDPLRDLAYVYGSDVDGSSSVRVLNTNTWKTVFEYQIFPQSLQPAGGFTQFILENYSDGYPIGIPVPPANQTWLAAGDTSVVEGDVGVVYLQFPVRLNRPATTPVTVKYATSSNDSAPGVDYLPVSGTLTFAPGQILKYVKVAVPGNIAPSWRDRFVNLTLSQATGAYLVDDTAVGLIEDPDQPVYVHFDKQFSSGVESKSSFDIHLVLDHAVPIPVSVTYYLVPDIIDTNTSASATLGKDVTGIRGTVTFQPGQTVASFPIKIVNDSIDEYDEPFRIVLDEALGGIFLPGYFDSFAQYQINDDDAPPVITLSPDRIVIREDADPFSLIARLSSPSEKPVTGFISTTGTAVLNEDFYVGLDSQYQYVTINPGETFRKVTVQIVDDSTYELNKLAIFRLTDLQNATLKPNNATSLLIIDNDPPPRFSFDTTQSTAVRNGQPFYVAVLLSNDTQVKFHLRATVLPGSTAIEGRDYLWEKRTIRGIYANGTEYLILRFLPQAPGTPIRTLKLGLQPLIGALLGTPSTITLLLVDA